MATKVTDRVIVEGFGLVPRGGIIMWSGAIGSVPSGWSLCNGANGTPDLRNRFIVGAGSTYDVGDVGGDNTVTLTVDQMPAHTHRIARSKDGQDYGGADNVFNLSNPAKNLPYTNDTELVQETGGDQAHENRPPYYALAYIMKL